METCPYSAKKLYIDKWKKEGCPKFDWPYHKVSLVSPAAEDGLCDGIKNTYFGKCVFRYNVDTNPHVTDHQFVQMQFENGVTAAPKMVFAAEAGRRINLFGTYGEILFDERDNTIEIMPCGEKKEAINIGALLENAAATEAAIQEWLKICILF